MQCRQVPDHDVCCQGSSRSAHTYHRCPVTLCNALQCYATQFRQVPDHEVCCQGLTSLSDGIRQGLQQCGEAQLIEFVCVLHKFPFLPSQCKSLAARSFEQRCLLKDGDQQRLWHKGAAAGGKT
eukprot:scaffold6146_cov18-Tisochrysis_lutea.AAC.1